MTRTDRSLPEDPLLLRRLERRSAHPLSAAAEPGLPRAAASGASTALERPPVEAIALHKMAFGPRPGDVARVQQMGLAAYVDEQLHPETLADTDCDQRLAAQQFELLDADVPSLWARGSLQWPGPVQGYDEVVRASWTRAIYSRRQLLEVLVDHWHNHFNVYGGNYPIYLVWPDYHRRIRRNVFGNFRMFLDEIAKSAAMLYYLDNSSSSDSGPNENYARELFELHTLSVEAYEPGIQAPPPGVVYAGYRDWDVYEAARALTGWTVRDQANNQSIGNTGEFYYRDEWHDRFQKYLLNEFIPPEQAPMKDGHDVLDRVARHPATARNVARRLARRLVADKPSRSLVEAGAAAFTTNLDAPDQLRHVVRALLTHADFTGLWGEKLKRPFEAMVYALRATEAEWSWSGDFDYTTGRVGQPLYEWRPPDGYPDTRTIWLDSTRMAQRWSFFNSVCEGFVDETVVDLRARTPQSLVTARQIVDFWVERVLGYLPSESERTPLYEFLARGRNLDIALPAEERDERLNSLVGLVLASPAAQLR